MSTVTQKIQDQVSSLYIAFFGRAPDAKGFGHWAEELAAGASPFKIAADFALSPEWTSNYGGLTPTQQVNRFYQNTFGRQADAAGLEYWVDEIEGGLPFSTVAYQIIWAAYLGGDTVDPADNALVLNKIAVAEYFAIELSSNDTAIAATAFVGVTQNPATVTAAEARLADAVNPPETFTLTTGADYIAALGAANINGLLANNGGSNTWQTWDTIQGGSGVDTLTAELRGGTVVMSNVSSIENLNLNVSSAGQTIDAVGATYLANIDAVSDQALTINNLASLPTISLSSTALTTLNFDTAALIGANTLNLSLTGGQTGGITITDDGTAALETLAISSSSANTISALTTSALGATTLNISGSGPLTITAITDAQSTLRTIDGSTSTGGFNVTALNVGSTITGGSGNDSVTGGTGNDNISGGAGNDTVTFAANGLTSNDTVNGGEGVNTLVLTTADADTTTTLTRVTNMQTLQLSDSLGTALVTTTNIASSINRVNFTTAGVVTGTIAFGAGASTLGVNINDSINTGSLTIDAAGTGTNDSLTIINMLATGLAFMSDADLIITDYETVTFNTGSTSNTTQFIDILNTGTAALSISGSNGLTTTTTSGVITAASINASGLTGTGGLIMGAAAAAGLSSIVGSSNADTLIGDASSSISGGAGNDIITGGAGNDTLLGEAGNDTISGGAGNDNIDGGEGSDLIVVASGNITANDTISGGDGTDILSYTTYVAAVDNDAAALSRVSNFETLRIAGVTGGAQQALSMANFVNNAGFTTLQLGANATANGVNLSNASATLNTLAVIAAAAGTNTFDRLVDTSTDSLTISNSTAAAGAASTITALTALDEETITITASVPTTPGANDLTITTLTVADLTTLNITSASDVIISDAIVGATQLATVNASAATGVTTTVNASNSIQGVTMTGNENSTGAANFVGSATVANVLTGGGGADALTGGSGADTIVGGGGADSITGSNGIDSLTGGAGADDFIMSNIVSGAGTLAVDVITDFSVAQGDQIGTYGAADLESIIVNNAALFGDLVGAQASNSLGATAVITDEADFSAAFDLDDLAANTNVVLVDGNWNTSTLQAAIRANVTADFGMADNDGFVVVYDNGVNSFVALVTSANVGTATGGSLADAVVTNLTTLNGISDATTLVSSAWLAFTA